MVGVVITAATKRIMAAVAATVCLGLVAAACGGGGQPPSASPTPSLPAAQLSITPADGATKVKPQKGIRISVSDGTIVHVTVTTKGDPVPGALNPAATTWRNRWALDVSDAVHGERHGSRRGRAPEHRDKHVSHPHSPPDVRHADLRGVPPDLRRRHARDAHVQPSP